MITLRTVPWTLAATALLCAGGALARLPAPDDGAKAKAAQAATRSAYDAKVASYQLCRSMERVAAVYFEHARAAGRAVNPPVPTPSCADPGPFTAQAEPPQPAATTTEAPPQVSAPVSTAGPKK